MPRSLPFNEQATKSTSEYNSVTQSSNFLFMQSRIFFCFSTNNEMLNFRVVITTCEWMRLWNKRTNKVRFGWSNESKNVWHARCFRAIMLSFGSNIYIRKVEHWSVAQSWNLNKFIQSMTLSRDVLTEPEFHIQASAETCPPMPPHVWPFPWNWRHLQSSVGFLQPSPEKVYR